MRTLIKFKLFVAEIQASNSKKYKQEVLKKFKDDEDIKRYLKIAFDPYTVYGISYKKLSTQIRSASNYIPKTKSVFELFDYLAVHNTGTFDDILECCNALEAVAAVDQESAFILTKLICKDLSIGVEAKTINSVIPGLIPTFSVMLAEKYFDKPERVEGKEFAITTKIDGGRIIAIKENGQVSFFTRAGQKYEGLVDLEREMLERIPDNFVLDGEITLLDYKNYDSKTAYKLAMKITRADGEKHNVKMLVFDGMPLDEWKTQQSTLTWTERRHVLNCIAGFYLEDLTYFELLPVLYQGTDTSKITELLDEAIANKQEGIMINICDAPYEFKRTTSLLKVKKMSTVDLEIVGYEEGSGRLSGTLGAILVRYKKGNIVKVGSGFSDELRALIWLEPSDFIGKIVEVQYFEETTNADGGISLRFPIFKDFRPDKLEADF
jgi:DNA ligase-1